MTKTLYAEFTVKPGHEARVAEMMATLTTHVRNEPATLQRLHPRKYPRSYFVFEIYRETDPALYSAISNYRDDRN